MVWWRSFFPVHSVEWKSGNRQNEDGPPSDRSCSSPCPILFLVRIDIENVGFEARQYAEQANRSVGNARDVQLAMADMGTYVRSLSLFLKTVQTSQEAVIAQNEDGSSGLMRSSNLQVLVTRPSSLEQQVDRAVVHPSYLPPFLPDLPPPRTFRSTRAADVATVSGKLRIQARKSAEQSVECFYELKRDAEAAAGADARLHVPSRKAARTAAVGAACSTPHPGSLAGDPSFAADVQAVAADSASFYTAVMERPRYCGVIQLQSSSEVGVVHSSWTTAPAGYPHIKGGTFHRNMEEDPSVVPPDNTMTTAKLQNFEEIIQGNRLLISKRQREVADKEE